MAMILQKIIDQIDINVPNSLPTDIKIGFVNRIIEEYYRDHPTPDAVYPFITVIDQDFYDLPDNCPEDRITSLIIDTIPYVYRDLRQPEFDYSWGIVSEQIEIIPTPTAEVDCYLYYRPRPEGLTEDDLDSIPGFAPDYQEMLIYGGSERTAMTLPVPDYQKALYYDGKFNSLAEKADRKLKKPSQRQVAIYRRYR